MPDGLYDIDFYLWTQEQARLLRDCVRADTNLPLDWENLAGEIDSVGQRDRREVVSRTTLLIEHLLKLQFSTASRSRARWASTVWTQRLEIEQILKQSPSLNAIVAVTARERTPAMAEELARELDEAGDLLRDDRTRLEAAALTTDQLLSDWLPDPPA